MAFLHRKMLLRYLPEKGFTISITCCRKFPPPPPPDDDIDDVSEQRSDVTLPLTTIVCIVCGAFLSLLLVFYLYLFIKRSQHNRSMVSRDPAVRQEGEEDIGFSGEEDRGTHVDHHVWHIATVGLRRSAINSITAFRYKKDERLIDGTECSVCLNEFQDDESLRLLPKCSHAFHIGCIDTWLLSHKNCPLCRAPVLVVNETITESRHERVINHSDHTGSSNEPTSEEQQSGNAGEIGDGTENKDRSEVSGLGNTNFMSRAQSDLANHRRPECSRTVRRCHSIGGSLQRARESGRGTFHLGAKKIFSWRGSRIQDPVLPNRRTGSGPV